MFAWCRDYQTKIISNFANSFPNLIQINLGTNRGQAFALFCGIQKAKNNSNDGCWRSNFEYHNIEWLIEEIKFSLSNLVNFYIKEDHSYEQRFLPSINRIDHWTNINEPKSSNRLHVHRSYDYVAVYYLQGEGTGDLTFHNPANLMSECGPNSPFSSRMSYQPKDGDLLLWPGWLPHEVEINNSEKQRVNIAFNIKL